MSYLSHVRFDVKAGKRDDFVRCFKAAEMLTRPEALPGYEWGKLTESCEDGPTYFMVIAQWTTEADYRHWQSISMKQLDRELIRDFLDCLETPTPGTLFKVVSTSRE